VEIRGSRQQLNKGKYHTQLQKTRMCWGTTHSSVSLFPWENHGANPLGSHFWAQEEESDWEKPAKIHQG